MDARDVLLESRPVVKLGHGVFPFLSDFRWGLLGHQGMEALFFQAISGFLHAVRADG